jgi:hypothetical protein
MRPKHAKMMRKCALSVWLGTTTLGGSGPVPYRLAGRRTRLPIRIGHPHPAGAGNRARPLRQQQRYVSWKRAADGSIRVDVTDRPTSVNLWQATNAKARDFRLDVIGAAYTSTTLTEASPGIYGVRPDSTSQHTRALTGTALDMRLRRTCGVSHDHARNDLTVRPIRGAFAPSSTRVHNRGRDHPRARQRRQRRNLRRLQCGPASPAAGTGARATRQSFLTWSKERARTSTSSTARPGDVFSYPLFRDLEREQRVFSTMAAFRDFAVNASYKNHATRETGSLGSGAYFSTLGLRPALGRLLAPADDAVLASAFVVVVTMTSGEIDSGPIPP